MSILSPVDASRAGAGNLEILIQAAEDSVPNFVKSEGGARFEVSFTPQVIDSHSISVKFNGETVPGMCVVPGIPRENIRLSSQNI